MALGLLPSGINRRTPGTGLQGTSGSCIPAPAKVPILKHAGQGTRAGAWAGTHLGIVLSSGEEGQLVGGGEVGSNLLHLPKALPLPPLGPPVLEPDLQDKAVIPAQVQG